ncbi:MAG: TetR/AcrR family transcriptional regulator [Candidatus Eremiobacteraeota bacterium]|nr:TetR/AcrR family transcriptional regulator [Candidatus Eremiobacteraeota bacterium]
MFKNTPKSEATRAHILDSALSLFRKRGFEETTMREIALRAGTALGSAYYYFPRKDAIVFAYYDQVQDEHERLCALRAAGGDLSARVRASLRTKLEILQGDRALLGALFARLGKPNDPLGVFSESTREQRTRSIETFARAMGDERLAQPLRSAAPALLWFIHLGLIFYMLYDESPGQRRTFKLTDAAAGIFVTLLKLSRIPGMGALQRRVLGALAEAQVL